MKCKARKQEEKMCVFYINVYMYVRVKGSGDKKGVKLFCCSQ